MNRRLGTVAIVLMALTALAAVLSFVFFSQPVPKNSNAAQPTTTGDSPSTVTPTSSSSSSSSETINPDPSEPLPVPNSLPLVAASPRPDQPPKLKPQPPSRSPDWKLLDWSLKPVPEKPGIQLRASSYLAPGKYPFVRVEEEIQILPNGEVKVLRTAEMVGDQIIVKLPKGSAAEEIQSLALKLGGQAAAKPFAPDTWLVALPRKLEAVPEALAGSTDSGISIDYAEPNHLVRPMRTPNDPRFTNFSQWHLYNNSQIDKDIKAPRAWDRRTSAAYGTTNKVIVAVIDSGVRYTHEDLLPNMWTNPGETPDGMDNSDSNLLVDDVYGYDFRDGDGDPMTTDSHGTRCAGLIAAVGNNGLGISGVAWSGVQIMALRFIDGTGSISDGIKCIDYAISMGAKVINASYGASYIQYNNNISGDNVGNNSEAAAIYRAQEANIVFVAAAGNSGTNNDTTPFYPASYSEYVDRIFPKKAFPLNNIISVGATDRNDERATFSNFGSESVDLMAPGVEMMSLTALGDSTYGADQGTSFAAPVVAGAVALLIAEYPNDTVSQRVARVISTNAVDVIPALNGLCVTGGRLNLAKLLPPNTNPLAVANAWHLPFNQETQISSTMRNPTNNLTTTSSITIHAGLQKFNNPDFGMANQIGGAVLSRTSDSSAWITNSFRTTPVVNSGNNQYWSSVFSNLPAGTNQYILRLDFDSGAQTTFIYAQTPSSSITTTSLATAQSSPFSFTVFKAAAAVTINGTNQTYNGSARSVSISTTPSGLSTTVTYNGSSSAPTNAGTYTVVATVTDADYEGAGTNALTITKASATISLGNLSQTYDGTQKAVSVTTSPTNLPVAVTYDGLPTAPANAGSYEVIGTVTDSNYLGSSTNTLTISKATQTITFSTPSNARVGEVRNLSATATSGLPVSFISSVSSIASVSGTQATFGAPGGVTLTASQAGNENYLAATNVAVSVSVSGVQDPSADDNRDGIPNLVEHALGTNSSGSVLPILLPPTNGVLTLTAIVRTNDEGLTFTAHGVTNLFDYTETNLVSQILGTADGVDTNNVPVGFQRQEFRYTNNAARAFLKLTIQQQ